MALAGESYAALCFEFCVALFVSVVFTVWIQCEKYILHCGYKIFA